jgi:sialate O-acetylesterase
LQVADIFSDHMVLQANQSVPIWGTATAHSQVEVLFAGQTITTHADAQGQWHMELAPLPPSGEPQVLTVNADQSETFKDVLIGEVWYASGQSNMDWKLAASANKLPVAQAIMEQANHPLIRYRAVKTKEQSSIQSRIGDGNSWSVCTPATARGFSAVAFLYARNLHLELNVPIGIIESAWGGHPIEPYIPRTAFTGHAVLEQEAALSDKKDMEGLRTMIGGVYARNDSWLCGTLFNSRVAPVAPYAIRGAIWYQAESNCGKGEDPRFYAEKMQALIQGWRDAWVQPKMPVYIVQLPQHDAPGWVPMRDEQRRSVRDPHAGMAVTIDLAHDGIHPANKIDVADRLVRWPLAKEYGRDLVPSGPQYIRMRVKDGAVIVYFKFPGGGLVTGKKVDLQPTQILSGTSVNGFEIADNEGGWHTAEARIEGDTVTCRSDAVSQPTGVRYAWAPMMPDEQPWNLYNRAGLPASPFISDIELAPYTP